MAYGWYDRPIILPFLKQYRKEITKMAKEKKRTDSYRKNAKKFRHGEEYGSARWGTPKDIDPYMDKENFENNILLTQTELAESDYNAAMI